MRSTPRTARGSSTATLKPDNILLAKSGVKVLDFGLAKITKEGPLAGHSATMTRALTDAGSIVGTLQYMSPEQLEGKEADARSDIFSFGCVLYEILTGKPAFHATSQATLIAAIIDREPEPMTAHQPMLPPMLERVVKKCLAKDPDKRWQHIADLKSELEWVLESGSNPAIPAPVVAQRRRNARLGWVLAGIFAALLVAAAVALFIFRPAREPLRTIRFEIPLPDGVTWGTTDVPMVSPDGSRVVFGGTKRDGAHALWMRSLDAVPAVPIPGTEGALFAAWSSDGRSIAFVADNKLKRLDLAGGAPQILGPMSAWGVPAWSQTGVILFERNANPYSLEQIAASGGESKPATTVAEDSLEHSHPAFLPGGRRFLYWGTGNGADGGVYVGSLDSKETRRLTTGSSGVFVPPGWLLNVRDSRLVAQAFDAKTQQLSGDPTPIADQVWVRTGPGGALGGFSVSQNGVLVYRRGLPPPENELTWYDRQGTRLKAEGEPGVYTNPALSPDGKRLAVGRYDAAADARDIWVLDLSRGVSSRFTFDKADDLNPVWSPDGSRIAFSSDRKGARDIYWKEAGGASAEQLVLATKESKSVEDWSPDGKLLLFNVNTEEVRAVPLSGAPQPSSILKAPFAQSQGHLSPDGRWIRVHLERVRQAGGLRAKLSDSRRQVAGLPERWKRAVLAARWQGAVLHERQQDLRSRRHGCGFELRDGRSQGAVRGAVGRRRTAPEPLRRNWRRAAIPLRDHAPRH